MRRSRFKAQCLSFLRRNGQVRPDDEKRAEEATAVFDDLEEWDAETSTMLQLAVNCLVIGLSVYVAVSLIGYAFRHPHLTDTELLFRLREALLWR